MTQPAFTRVDPRISGNITGHATKTIILVADGTYGATASAEFNIGTAHYIEACMNLVTCDSGASLIFCLEGYNPASGNWDTLANTGALSTAVGCALTAGPATPAITDNAVSRVLRERMRVTVHHADTKCAEYSIILSGQ